MKVAYVTTGEWASDALIDDEPVAPDTHVGVDSFTDRPVTVRWDGEKWIEVPL